MTDFLDNIATFFNTIISGGSQALSGFVTALNDLFTGSL